MDGTHKHAIHASRWFILPCLVHIALLLIYLPSSRSHHLTGVYLSCLVSLLVAVHVHVHMCVRPFDICVCVCVIACLSASAFVWTTYCLTWQEVTFPQCSPSSFCHGTKNSVVMVTAVIDSICVTGRQICMKCFPLLSGQFPSCFCFFYIHLCVCMLVSFPCLGKVDEHALSSSSSTSDCNTCWHPADSHSTELFGLCKTGMIIFNATLLNYLYFVLVQVYILLKFLELVVWCWSDPKSKGWIGNQWPPLISFIFCYENRK